MKEINLNSFPSISNDEWHSLAKNQLKGVDLATLDWLADQTIPMSPYHDSSDLKGLEYQTNFFADVQPFNWKLYEEIEVTEEKIANEKAIEALQGGCDGIIFKIYNEVNAEALLQNILTEICDVSVHDSETGISIHGFKNQLTGFEVSGNCKTAFSSRYKSENQVTQIVDVIKNLNTETHILRTASVDFFLEIASIRAIRFLLSDHLKKDPWSIQIHTSVPLHSSTDHQWFYNSTAGLASILGGTSSICFGTAQGNSRISRNVGNIIREESGITAYTDQCGGSYFIEALTHKIIIECQKLLS